MSTRTPQLCHWRFEKGCIYLCRLLGMFPKVAPAGRGAQTLCDQSLTGKKGFVKTNRESAWPPGQNGRPRVGQAGYYFDRPSASGDATVADITGAAKIVLTEAGSLSSCASNRLTCHIWVSFRDCLKPGIPVRRIPFATFQ